MAQTFAIKCFESVNNDTLPKLGELRLRLNNITLNPRKQLWLYMGEDVEVRTNKVDMYSAQTGGTNYGHTCSVPANTHKQIWFGDCDGYVFIGNIVQLQQLRLNGSMTDSPVLADLDLRDFRVCPYLTAFYMESPYGPIAHGAVENLIVGNCTLISLIGTRITGNTNHFANCPVLNDFRLWGTGVTGKMSDLAKSIGLTRFSTTSPNVVEDWQDLCDGMVANGRTSGSIRIESHNSDFYVDFDPGYTGGWRVRP